MALADFVSELDQLAEEAASAFDSAADIDSVEQSRVAFLGAKSGRLKLVQKNMAGVDGPDKPAAGKKLNEVKQKIQSALESAQSRLKQADQISATDDTFDPTVPGSSFRVGKLHPITQTIDELMDIMGRLGFSLADGPEVEDKLHNFEALNIPPEHPARDPLENFYLSAAKKTNDDPLLLRSQTSTVQIRVMEKTPPPIRIISLGRVYRPDTADDTHYPMFHQMEGLMIDRAVTMSDLKTVLRLFATSYLGGDVHVRFRPSFFPFTEPSVEADYHWNDQWVEFGGAGMVDPNVLKAVGYDPDEVSGFAFGLGVERLCMRRHQITNIRDMFNNDVRFLHQF